VTDGQFREVGMRVPSLRLLVVAMAIVAVLLVGAAISLHQMYPMRIADAKSEEDRRWMEMERDRRSRELLGNRIGILAAAGIDVAGIILVIAFDRRRQRVGPQ
jgi:hypothetical protein